MDQTGKQIYPKQITDFCDSIENMLRIWQVGRANSELHNYGKRANDLACVIFGLDPAKDVMPYSLGAWSDTWPLERKLGNNSTRETELRAWHTKAEDLSPPGKQQLWDDESPEYMDNSEAIVTFTKGKLKLPRLTKQLNKPNNQIRFMRKGRRCKVHIGDFKLWAEKRFPTDKFAAEIADEVLADREARKKEIRESSNARK